MQNQGEKLPEQVFIPMKRLTKTQIDIQLIEACVLEKWNPRANGCIVEGNEAETCVLCQVYYISYMSVWQTCKGCPIGCCSITPYWHYVAPYTKIEELNALEAEIEFLISLLPETHQWRIKND